MRDPTSSEELVLEHLREARTALGTARAVAHGSGFEVEDFTELLYALEELLEDYTPDLEML